MCVHAYYDDNFTDPVGYYTPPKSVTFRAGLTETSFRINTRHDTVLENDEVFFVHVNYSSKPATSNCHDMTEVTIKDNDGTYVCMYIQYVHI